MARSAVISGLRLAIVAAEHVQPPRTRRPPSQHALRAFSTSAERRSHDGPSSVSDTEVSHFNALAADWWSPHGSSRLLHLMNPLRHDFIASCLTQSPSPPPKKNLRYLDVGCGGGIFAESAARLPSTSSVLGIDPTPGVLEVARAHARRDPLLQNTGRLEYRQASIEDLSAAVATHASPANGELQQQLQQQQQQQQRQQFDILCIFEVVEHVRRPSEFLQRCLPLVKPGGWIVGSTIARTTASWITTKVVAEDILGIVPRGTHDWDKYINEDELRSWFAKQAGWEQFRSQGVVYVPALGWKVIPRSEQYGNYFFGARKSMGSP